MIHDDILFSLDLESCVLRSIAGEYITFMKSLSKMAVINIRNIILLHFPVLLVIGRYHL